jgi:TgpA N-terminal domain/Transglutaminase-like superfamily
MPIPSTLHEHPMSAQLRLSAYAALATIAAATSLTSVFAGKGWVIPVMGAIVIVAAACSLVRASPLPSALEPIAAAVAVLLWVTLLDSRSKAHFGFIPGRLALHHLGRTARAGFTEIHRLPTPAPTHHGLVLLAVVGVAAIALIVDLMTVTLRRAALSGLPLLALFTVCAATGHHGVGLFPFIFAAIGYLWLLYADNREKVARWGAAVGTGSRARPASAWSTDESAAPAPASLGRRVAAMAISLGVIVPLFIPGLHTGIDKHGNGPGGSGGGDKIVLNPIVSVATDLTSSKVVPVISYRTSSADPGYLRLTSLDQFNGITFSSNTLQAPARAAASSTLPVTPPEGPIVSSAVTVSSNLALHWLPIEATALGVSVGDSWRYDPGTATVFSATTTTEGLSYTASSVADNPSPSQLAVVGASQLTPALQADVKVPSSVSAAVRRLTRSITAKAKTPYDEALAIQSYFTTGNRFLYDTSIKADNSPNALADFLLHSRRGFCQQFATAMAVMARLSGIPARVAVGFTRGAKQSDGSWLVTTHDAHAWPELYFQGYGWLAFEPTPRGDGQAVALGYAKAAVGAHPTKSQSAKTPSGTASPLPLPKTGLGSTSSKSGPGGGAGGGAFGGHLGLVLLAVILLALILALPSSSRAIVRRRRWRRLHDPSLAADAAWAELRDTAIDLRVPWDDGHTPRQIAAAVLVALPSDTITRESMQRLAQGEERSRYAPTSSVTGTTLRVDVSVIRSAAAARRSRFQRTVARVMPRSTLRVAGRGASRVGDVLYRFDRLSARIGRAARGRSRLSSV